MASRAPWSIKGIEPEAREAAKMAARKTGMTLGGWLTRTILAAAANELKRGGQKAPAEWTASGGEGDFAGPSPPALTEEAILKSIQHLIQRVEHIEQATQETVAPIAKKVEELAAHLHEVSEKTGIATGPMERALQRLTERMEKMEGPEPTAQERHRPHRGRLARLFNLP